MTEKKFCVYKHVFPNGKLYFGITSKAPNKRWQNGTGYDSKHQPVVYNAIKKYGWENIKHIIMVDNISYSEACEKEQALIKKYKTNCKRYGNDYGYNMTDGGEGTLGHKVSKETKLKMSKARTGKTGKNCPNSRKVICDNIKYDSLTEFKNINHPKGAIYQWLNGTKAMPKEWYDKKLRYADMDFSIVKCQTSSWQNQVMYDNMTFDSQSKLADYLNVEKSTLCNWLNGKLEMPQKYRNKGLKRIK
jgi:group I intron endonuclease